MPLLGQKYTVLLLYPDYMSDSYGQEIYLAHVRALSIKGAITKAQKQFYSVYSDSLEAMDDLFTLFVTYDHHMDLKP